MVTVLCDKFTSEKGEGEENVDATLRSYAAVTSWIIGADYQAKEC